MLPEYPPPTPSPIDPFYYLENFHKALEWIAERYGDLLTAEEQAFIEGFPTLPQASRALLVRMIMRKGDLFRASKLKYGEIGCTREAARPLAAMGWIDDDPQFTLENLFGLLTKNEIAEVFRLSPQMKSARKADQLEMLRADFAEPRRFAEWHADTDERVYHIRVATLCDRLRLMYFGNLHQDWSEFVLADLGIFRYEKVEFSSSSRGFRTRRDVDLYLRLHECRERFREGETPHRILEDMPAMIADNDWLEGRRAKLLFQIAQHHERTGDLEEALSIYSTCTHPGARIRAVRVLEQCERFDAAFELAQAAVCMPENETEKQQLARIVPRLRRKLRMPKLVENPSPPTATIDLTLGKPDSPFPVEWLAKDHLTQSDAPVYYVENALSNSLFGLLCWKAIFAAVPGAFFHPFHTGPADLSSSDFHRRREREFAECLAQLDSERYRHTIMENFRQKAGIQSPFVYWDALSEDLMDLALTCIPASHLKKWFERMLLDIPSNRAGFPDLIQFWPTERRYRMIEVKGPGDRLQDNQKRWLDYFSEHEMPVAVCYVRWTESAA